MEAVTSVEFSNLRRLDGLPLLIYDIHKREYIQLRNLTNSAAFNNLSECSLNFRIKGRAPFCFPACIVASFWVEV